MAGSSRVMARTRSIGSATEARKLAHIVRMERMEPVDGRRRGSKR